MSHRFFLLRRLLRYTFAEIAFLLGNLAPRRTAILFWQIALALNPHHVAAALNRARALQMLNDANAWRAFQDALRAIENPQHTSASDLALTWVPGRWVRHLAQRLLWREVSADYLMELHDRRNQDLLAQLAQTHCAQMMVAQDWLRARLALEVWERTQPGLACDWAHVELEFHAGNFSLAAQRAASLIEPGNFLAPLDAIVWAERWLEHGQLDLAETCLRWAEIWTPELADVWRLRGRLAQQRGNANQAHLAYERALALAPDDLATFLAWQSLTRAQPLVSSSFVRLHLDAPATMHLGEQASLTCQLDDARGEWEIHVLPPAGWGIVATPRHQHLDAQHRCTFTLRACRPHRIHNEVWTLTVVAMSDAGFVTSQVRIAVPDDTPGQVLVINSEDHEIWEERGTLSRDDLRRLFIKKSNAVAERVHPLTQMIEVGSTFKMLAEAAQRDETWQALRDEVRAALIKHVANGGDLQPHLHAFNDPTSPDFPYHFTPQGWRTDHQFLLTAEERRRDFARAFPPSERIARVAEVVAQVEALGRAGDPNYRAVMWRTGQLEFGDAANERAWSAVALLRAGILADSDLRAESPAFFAGIADPFVPRADGVLVQLPIWGNLEGNFLTDARALARRVRATIARLRQNDGALLPGVHLFTLLTHDKFINARRGGNEFRLDEAYGDWATIRAHLDEWRKQGATFVTAREGIAQFIDDCAWRLMAWLSEENSSDDGKRARYTLRLLGKNIPVSAAYLHHIIVTIPPSLRARVAGVHVNQGERALPVEWNRPDCFWVTVSSNETPIHCEFELG